jgi:hypothetical protein
VRPSIRTRYAENPRLFLPPGVNLIRRSCIVSKRAGSSAQWRSTCTPGSSRHAAFGTGTRSPPPGAGTP